MFAKKISSFLFLSLFLGSELSADPLNGGIELGTSVSNDYQARSVFTNPSALAFQSELNGPALLTSFGYASTFDKRSEFSLGASYGMLGFGLENLLSGAHSFYRYALGLGVPLTTDLYFGTRFSTTSSDAAALSGIHSLDLGMQYRAFSFVSFGFLANQLNQAVVTGIKTPVQYIAGTTLRPWHFVELGFDVDTLSDNFAKHFSYQASITVEVLQGLKLSGGYHSDNQLQLGFIFNLGRMGLYSVAQPAPKAAFKNTAAKFTMGFQSSALPHRSVAIPSSTLLVPLDSSLSQEGNSGNLLSKARPSLLDILETLKAAESDSTVARVVVHIDRFPLGLASAQEIFESLMRLREKGKRVEAYIQSAHTKEYLIASAAHHITMEPSGELTLLGPRSERYFAKGTLDKMGIEGEFLARGEYKSAPEMFTRREASPKSREATQHELESLETEILKLLARSRKISKADWEKFIKHAIFSAEDAIQMKLIDASGSYSEGLEKIRKDSLVRYSLDYHRADLSLPQRIAVITAEGDILKKRVRLLSLSGESQVTPERLEPLFKLAVADPLTKAIVFRVSSPGGEVLASHQIARFVENAKAKKPVIVSMGDVAASGGYMISAPATKIYADPLSITGSIGVFVGKFNLGGLYKKLDLGKEITGRGPFIGIDTESRAWTSEERGLMHRRLNQYYDGFVSFVASHRKISKEVAEKAAKGRVWLGAESSELKIIDKQGGLLDAIAEASTQSGAQEGFEVWQLRDEPGLFDLLSDQGLMASTPNAELAKEFSSLLFSAGALQDLHWIVSLSENPFLYLAVGTRVE